MDERAAERAAVAHLRVTDRARHGRQQRRLCGHEIGRRQLVVAGARADGQLVALDPHVPQLASRPMSISSSGAARRSFITGSSEWPPASTLASSPCSARRASAPSRVSGRS